MTEKPQSPALAADPSRFELWDCRAPFPAFDEMPDLDVVTHVSIERATPDGYHYLHESSIAAHHGKLYLGWANHRVGEVNVRDELIRGKTSTDDGLTWSAAETWVAPPTIGGESFSHPALATHAGRLWGFFTCFHDEKPRTEVFTLDDATGKWEPRGSSIPGFLTLRPPMKMRDGNWIMAGEDYWYEAAVAISAGDDWTRWELIRIPRPESIFLKFPETTLVDQGDRLVAFCRPHEQPTAPVSVSRDCGRTWSVLEHSNFPLAGSQPYAGVLSTGQHYLITNNLEEGRTLLSIAVTAPGAHTFSRVWKIRHQQYPKRRHWPGVFWKGKLVKPMIGTPTEWSYPAAIEHGGNLYVCYTQGKEDCALSIIPTRALAAS
jgi:hypothetical protein